MIMLTDIFYLSYVFVYNNNGQSHDLYYISVTLVVGGLRCQLVDHFQFHKSLTDPKRMLLSKMVQVSLLIS